MNSASLRTHLASLGVTAEGIEYVVQSALAPAQMRLKSGPQQNIVGDISTRLKTFLDDAVTGDVVPRLQIASQSAEHAFFVHLEAQSDVLLALNHPLSVPIEITNSIGRSQRISYTGDALVVFEKRTLVAELKTDDEANELVEKRPHDWRRSKGGFEYLPAKEYFAELGLAHEVVVSSTLPWLKTRNLQMLARLRDWPSGLHKETAQQDVIAYVRAHSPCSILQLIAACGLPNAVPVLHMIKDGAIHVDMDRAILSSPETRFVCSTLQAARNAAAALSSIQAIARTNTTIPFSKAGDPKHIDELGFRISVLAGQPAERDQSAKPGKEKKPPSLRTKQRWKKAHREGGVHALAPKWANSGNRKRRLKYWHLKFLLKHIKAARRSSSAQSRTQAHTDYTTALEAESKRRKRKTKPISYGYYCRIWSRRKHNVGDAHQRGGRRLANALAPHGDVDKQQPMATGPFQLAHIDHCLAPSHSFSLGSEEQTEGLPWLTLLVDDWASEPLAAIISMEYPSTDTDLALIRDCVRRHGRLPHAILSDHGPDFKGTAFIGSLAVLNVDGLLRPQANPRAGQPVERTFGTVADAVCRGHEGFALNIPNSRAISANKLPSRGKKRHLQDFVEHSEHLLFDVLPNLPAIGGGESKRQKRAHFELVYGEQGVPITRDLRFLIATAPRIKESGCFEPSGAIRLGEKRFYSHALVGQDFGSSKPILRREPDDSSIVYFAHAGAWRVAKARDALRNYGRSDEVIASEAHEQTRETQQQKNQRRKALHSKPAPQAEATTPKPIRCSDNEGAPPTKASTPVTLSDVKAPSSLPPAFEPEPGSN